MPQPGAAAPSTLAELPALEPVDSVYDAMTSHDLTEHMLELHQNGDHHLNRQRWRDDSLHRLALDEGATWPPTPALSLLLDDEPRNSVPPHEQGQLLTQDVLYTVNGPHQSSPYTQSYLTLQPPTPRLAPQKLPTSSQPQEAHSTYWTPPQAEQTQTPHAESLFNVSEPTPGVKERPAVTHAQTQAQAQHPIESQEQHPLTPAQARQGVYGPWTPVHERVPTPYPRLSQLSISKPPQEPEPKADNKPERQHQHQVEGIITHDGEIPSQSQQPFPAADTISQSPSQRSHALEEQLYHQAHQLCHLKTLNAHLREQNTALQNQLRAHQDLTLRLQQDKECFLAQQLDRQAQVLRRQHAGELSRLRESADGMKREYEARIAGLRADQEFVVTEYVVEVVGLEMGDVDDHGDDE